MAFDRNDTYNRVVSIITDELKVEKDAVIQAASFQDLGADSLDMVQMVMKFEEQFGIEINDSDAEKLHNLDEVVQYVQERRTK